MPQLPVNLTALDYTDRINALREYFSNQDALQDVNYDGSVISAVIRLLAANSQDDAFYLNMVGSEMFLRSASRRESVIDQVSPLGYVPKSRRSAHAIVYMKFIPISGITAVIIPEKTQFTSKVDGKIFTFQTINDSFVLPNPDGEFETNIVITEGKLFRHKFAITNESDKAKFIIPNTNVDTESLVIRVFDNISDAGGEIYKNAKTLTDLNATSRPYFIEEVAGEYHRVYFGDGVFGKALAIGNIVQVDYLISSGEEANGAADFSLATAIPLIDTVTTLDTVSAAAGGAELESIESIRFNGPLSFEQQNRAVTESDYVRTIKSEYPFVEACSVWGGQNNDPPQFGYVFISIKPTAGYALSSVVKNQIETDLKQKFNVVSITPKIVDPETLFIKPTVVVFCDPTKKTITLEGIATKVKLEILRYSSEELVSFENAFRISRFGTFVDNIDESITSNTTRLQIGTRFIPDSNQVRTYDIKFHNKINPKTVNSTFFTYGTTKNCSIIDDGFGVLQLQAPVGLIRATIINKIGTVNYATGAFVISATKLYAPTGQIELTASVESIDIVPVRNQLLLIKSEDVTVLAEIDSSLRGMSSRT